MTMVSWLITKFYRRTMASNQAEIIQLGELSNREQEIVGISDHVKEISLKAGLASLLILAMAFIALPVVSLFSRSSLETTFRSLHDPMVIDALKLSLTTSTLATVIVVDHRYTHCLCQCPVSLFRQGGGRLPHRSASYHASCSGRHCSTNGFWQDGDSRTLPQCIRNQHCFYDNSRES